MTFCRRHEHKDARAWKSHLQAVADLKDFTFYPKELQSRFQKLRGPWTCHAFHNYFFPWPWPWAHPWPHSWPRPWGSTSTTNARTKESMQAETSETNRGSNRLQGKAVVLHMVHEQQGEEEGRALEAQAVVRQEGLEEDQEAEGLQHDCFQWSAVDVLGPKAMER